MEIEASGLEWGKCLGQGPDGADIITCYCQIKDHSTICVRIEDYAFHYYWSLPLDFDWDDNMCMEVHSVLKRSLRENGRHILPYDIEYDLVYKRPLYYVSSPQPALRLRFSTFEAARHASNILKRGITVCNEKITGEVVEYDISHVRKLLTDVDITHCQWFKCIGKPVPPRQKISTCPQEFIVSYQSIKPSTCTDVPRPMFCAYDIEEYCDNHNKFPDAWNTKDDINVMSVAFMRDGTEPDEWIVYVIVVCDYIIDKPLPDNFKVLRVKDRIELIKTFASLVQKHDPDIFTGYNILAFDNKHIKAKLGLYDEQMPNIGRMIGKYSKEAGVSWSSSASKGKDLHWFDAPGRAFVDFYEHCTRNEKWPVYNLEYACKSILAKFPELRKKDLPAKEQFRIYKEVMDTDHLPREDPRRERALKDMGKFIEYCEFDSTLVLHMARVTNWWIGLREMCNAVGSGLHDLLTRGQQNRVLSLLYHHCTKNNIILNKRSIEEIFYYEGGLVQKPIKGVTDLCPTYDFKSLYPSVMISYNLSHDTLIHPHDWHKYPLDQVTIAKPYISDQDIDAEGDVDAKKVKAEDLFWEEAEFRFLKKETLEGVVPKILKLLLAERARVRGLQKTVPGDSVMWVVYEQRQLALKVCANSIYGFMGVKRGGKRPCLEISATTTFFGRDRISYTIDWIVDNAHRLITEFYNTKGWEVVPGHVYTAVLVYGDTDSCMMHFPGVPYEHIFPLAHHIGILATKEHAHLGPLELEMENICKICCIEQKHYAKLGYNDPAWGKPTKVEVDKDGKPVLTIKGLTPARRDSCDFVRTLMYDILFSAMTEGTYSDQLNILLRGVLNLYQGRVPIEDLVVTKGMGAHYKNANATMNVFAQQMAIEGQAINPGERHEYIVVNKPGEKKVSMKMMLLTLYYSKEVNKRPKMDAEYYFNNLLKKKVDKLFSSIFERNTKQCKTVSVVRLGREMNGLTPAKMLSALLKEQKCEPFRAMATAGASVTEKIAKAT